MALRLREHTARLYQKYKIRLRVYFMTEMPSDPAMITAVDIPQKRP